MEKFTYEQSVEAAKPIKKMNDAAMELDVEYLTEALKEMRENHSMRDSMAVLNPSPFTHNEQQDLNEAKLEQLELMLKLAKNVNQIKELTIKLHQAKGNANQLSRMFGL
jgi:hypothetical protein